MSSTVTLSQPIHSDSQEALSMAHENFAIQPWYLQVTCRKETQEVFIVLRLFGPTTFHVPVHPGFSAAAPIFLLLVVLVVSDSDVCSSHHRLWPFSKPAQSKYPVL